LLVALCVASASAHTARQASHLVPTGKGWAEERSDGPGITQPPTGTVPIDNGISYHDGLIMPGTVNIYYIWYGNWRNGPHPSDSASTVTLLEALASSRGLNGSDYAQINSTYSDNGASVTGQAVLHGTTTDTYSHRATLSDVSVQAVVASALSSGRLPQDPNGVYFVLTSSDVDETSGLCNKYCGWHDHATINGTDIKYAFVGNSDRCPSSCEQQTTSPNGNSGADGMASVLAHELSETLTDPDLDAWFDSSGQENGDKCAWKFGPTQTTASGAKYNQTLAGYHWLLQLMWENSRGGGCTQTLGGTFYAQ
jgi:hypothetical protein